MSSKSFREQLEAGIVQIAAQMVKEGITDEELAVFHESPAGTRINVDYINHADPDLLVLIGEDDTRNKSFVFAHWQTVQLIVKRVKITNETKRRKIGFVNDALKNKGVE